MAAVNFISKLREMQSKQAIDWRLRWGLNIPQEYSWQNKKKALFLVACDRGIQIIWNMTSHATCSDKGRIYIQHAGIPQYCYAFNGSFQSSIPSEVANHTPETIIESFELKGTHKCHLIQLLCNQQEHLHFVRHAEPGPPRPWVLPWTEHQPPLWTTCASASPLWLWKMLYSI